MALGTSKSKPDKGAPALFSEISNPSTRTRTTAYDLLFLPALVLKAAREKSIRATDSQVLFSEISNPSKRVPISINDVVSLPALVLKAAGNRSVSTNDSHALFSEVAHPSHRLTISVNGLLSLPAFALRVIAARLIYSDPDPRGLFREVLHPSNLIGTTRRSYVLGPVLNLAGALVLLTLPPVPTGPTPPPLPPLAFPPPGPSVPVVYVPEPEQPPPPPTTPNPPSPEPIPDLPTPEPEQLMTPPPEQDPVPDPVGDGAAPVPIVQRAGFDIERQLGIGGIRNSIGIGIIGWRPGPPPPPPLPSPPVSADPIPISSPPRRILGPQPHYPPEARRARAEGTVTLDVVIDETGVVTDVRVVRSPPLFADAFDEAAIAAVRQWRYDPYVQNDNPVAITTTVTVTFRLSS